MNFSVTQNVRSRSIAVPRLVECVLGDRLKHRDPNVLGEIYARYSNLLFRTIDHLLHDPAASEDLLQETFLKVWDKAELFDVNRGALKCWLITIARHTAIDYLRAQAVKSEPAVLENQDRIYDIELESLKSELRLRLGTAIEKLTVNQRTCIELAFFEDLSHSEMAQETKRPLGTVKTHVRLALHALREDLKYKPLAPHR